MKMNWHRFRTASGLGLVLGTMLLLAPARLGAAELTENEVRAAVQTWVRLVTADARPDAVIARMEAHSVGGEVVAYIAHLGGGGFCLCGADDWLAPVYLYSPGGTYNPTTPTTNTCFGRLPAE